jgi:hypothetical protein
MQLEPSSTISPIALRGRLAFTTFTAGGLLIDAVIAEPSSPEFDGTLTLRVSLPYSPWAIAAAALIQSWADTDTPVDFRFSYSASGHQVRLEDGMSMVLLDLRESPTLRLAPDPDSKPPLCA